eukprot:4031691-Pyramimonas_sp.AAC.1
MARDRSRQYRYHYFDDEQPRAGAHSFDAVYYMCAPAPAPALTPSKPFKLMSMSERSNLKVHAARIPTPTLIEPEVPKGSARLTPKTEAAEGEGVECTLAVIGTGGP